MLFLLATLTGVLLALVIVLLQNAEGRIGETEEFLLQDVE
jgi:hypothetical protein